MALEKHKFQRYKLEEEYQKADIVKVRLNEEERTWLDAMKKYHNSTKDSTVLKEEAFRIYKQLNSLKEIKGVK